MMSRTSTGPLWLLCAFLICLNLFSGLTVASPTPPALPKEDPKCPVGSLPQAGMRFDDPRGQTPVTFCCSTDPEPSTLGAYISGRGPVCCRHTEDLPEKFSKCVFDIVQPLSCPYGVDDYTRQRYNIKVCNYAPSSGLAIRSAEALDNSAEVKSHLSIRSTQCPPDSVIVGLPTPGLLIGTIRGTCCPKNAATSAVETMSGVFCCSSLNAHCTVPPLNVVGCNGQAPVNIRGAMVCPSVKKRDESEVHGVQGDVEIANYDINKRDDPIVLKVTTCGDGYIPVNAVLWGDQKLRTVCCPSSHVYYATLDPKTPQAVCHNSKPDNKGMFAKSVKTCAEGKDMVETYDGVMSCVKGGVMKRDLGVFQKRGDLATCYSGYFPVNGKLFRDDRIRTVCCPASHTAYVIMDPAAPSAVYRNGKAGDFGMFSSIVRTCAPGMDMVEAYKGVKSCVIHTKRDVESSDVDLFSGDKVDEKRELKNPDDVGFPSSGETTCPDTFRLVDIIQAGFFGTSTFRWTVCCPETAADNATLDFINGTARCCWQDVCDYPAASATHCKDWPYGPGNVYIGPRNNSTVVCVGDVITRPLSVSVTALPQLPQATSLASALKRRNDAGDSISNSNTAGCPENYQGVKLTQSDAQGQKLQFTACCPRISGKPATRAYIDRLYGQVACCFGPQCSYHPTSATSSPGGREGTHVVGHGDSATIVCKEPAETDGFDEVEQSTDTTSLQVRDTSEDIPSCPPDHTAVIWEQQTWYHRDARWTACCPNHAQDRAYISWTPKTVNCCFGSLCSYPPAAVSNCPKVKGKTGTVDPFGNNVYTLCWYPLGNIVELSPPALDMGDEYTPPQGHDQGSIERKSTDAEITCPSDYTGVSYVGDFDTYTACCPVYAAKTISIHNERQQIACCSITACTALAVPAESCSGGGDNTYRLWDGKMTICTEPNQNNGVEAPALDERDKNTMLAADIANIRQRDSRITCPTGYTGASLAGQRATYTACCPPTHTLTLNAQKDDSHIFCCGKFDCKPKAVSALKCPDGNGKTYTLRDGIFTLCIEPKDDNGLDAFALDEREEHTMPSAANNIQPRTPLANRITCPHAYKGVSISSIHNTYTACCFQPIAQSLSFAFRDQQIKCCNSQACEPWSVPAEKCPGGEAGTLHLWDGKMTICTEPHEPTKLKPGTPFPPPHLDENIANATVKPPPPPTKRDDSDLSICATDKVAIHTTSAQDGRDWTFTLCCPPYASERVVLNIPNQTARCCNGWLCPWYADSVSACESGMDGMMVLGSGEAAIMICRGGLGVLETGVQGNFSGVRDGSEIEGEATRTVSGSGGTGLEKRKGCHSSSAACPNYNDAGRVEVGFLLLGVVSAVVALIL
jgi:hypothetical protein